jgi:Rieske Fe-S protein
MSDVATNVFKDPMGQPVTPDSIPDNGAVVGFFGEDRAVVAKKDGKLIGMTAVCTHQGCTVGVIADEHTLDCPCHGSRYTLEGKVMEGPAVKSLSHYNVQAKGAQIVLTE